MALTPKFTRSDITRLLAGKKQIIETAILIRLQRVGETFVSNARNGGTYQDRTGNLRASTGYLILKDGVQLESSFPGSRAAGRNKSRELAEKVAAEITPKGFVLIVVAGMEYAAAVESKGYDVLTASSKIAEADLQRALKEISQKVNRLT